MDSAEQTASPSSEPATTDRVPPRRGAFILIEGVDRSGKTTLTRGIVADLRARWLSVVRTTYPNRTGDIGIVIDKYLRGESRLDARTMHMLFSADRWSETNAARQVLEDGGTLVVDRYSYSGIAYSIANGIPAEWAKQTERGLLKPDITLFLDVAPEIAATRGGYGSEVYDKAPMQRRVRKAFQELADDTWNVIDATQAPDVVRELALKAVLNVIDRVGDTPVTYFA